MVTPLSDEHANHSQNKHPSKAPVPVHTLPEMRSSYAWLAACAALCVCCVALGGWLVSYADQMEDDVVRDNLCPEECKQIGETMLTADLDLRERWECPVQGCCDVNGDVRCNQVENEEHKTYSALGITSIVVGALSFATALGMYARIRKRTNILRLTGAAV